MSANHSLILFEGNVTAIFPEIFNVFGLKLTGQSEHVNGLAEIWECTKWPRKGKPRNHVHKASLYNGTWTAILDREMTMIFEQEKCEHCAKRWNIKIFGYMIESVSGSCALYYYAPEKVRGVNVQNFEVLEDFGVPLPQEEGVAVRDMMEDGLMRISRRLGFADSLFAHPASQVTILGLEDPLRAIADEERSAVLKNAAGHKSAVRAGFAKEGAAKVPEMPPKNQQKKPWWRLW